MGIKSPPDFPPGQGWHYSNTNYVLLGMILKQVTGKKHERNHLSTAGSGYYLLP